MRNILLLFIGIMLFSCSTKSDIDISEYPIVTTVTELADYYDINIDRTGRYETTNITRYFDGSSELEYEYDLRDSEIHDPLYYSISIEHEVTLKDAKQVYNLGKTAIGLVANSFDQGTIEIDSLSLPGDENYYALRTYQDEPNGMLYTVRKGTRIYTMMISGIYTSDHSLITELLNPNIRNLEVFRISK